MVWTRLKITISEGGTLPRNFVEDVSNLLIINGADTFTVEDYSDLDETLSGGGIFFDYIDDELLESRDKLPVIYAFFGTDEEGEDLCCRVVSSLDKLRGDNGEYSSLIISTDSVKDEDWENNWRQYFKPFTVGERLVVKPTWETLTEDMAKGRHIIEIDPASSFGTGAHATTRLCMETLEKTIIGNEHVLDMGCGSGILTIAAMKLGAKDAVAVDIDEVAARIAKENMEQNNLDASSVQVFDGDVLSDKKLYDAIGAEYDVICANIVAGIIIMMAPMFYEKLKVGGSLIASGIISEREEEVSDALKSAGFSIEKSETSDDWSVILCKKAKK